jgi:hypothetical protein
MSEYGVSGGGYLLIQSVQGNKQEVAKLLQRKNEKHPALRTHYNRLVGQSINQSSMVWSLRAGQWIPQGDAAKIGPLFNIGGTVGGMTNKGDIVILRYFEGLKKRSQLHTTSVNSRDTLGFTAIVGQTQL